MKNDIKILKIILLNSFFGLIFFMGLEGFSRTTFFEDRFQEIKEYFREKTDKKRLEFQVPFLGSEKKFEIPSAYIFKKNIKADSYERRDIDYDSLYPKDYFSPIRGIKTFTVVARIKKDHEIIYSAKYVRNELGLRHVDNQENKKDTKYFLFLAGDSFTFGEGVNQGQDYPSLMALKLNKDWRVYNYGFHGHAPNDFLWNAQHHWNQFKDIAESEGIFVWLHIPEHLRRISAPYMSMCTEANNYFLNKPYYFLKNDSPTYLGKVSDLKRFKWPLNFFCSRVLSSFFDYFTINSEENIYLYFYLLEEGLKDFSARRKIKRKILILYNNIENKKFLEVAKKFSYEVFLFQPERYLPSNLDWGINPDGHPTPQTYWVLSSLLSDLLSK